MFWFKPTPPKPLNLWFNDIVSVSKLREMTEDPVFQQAVATLLAAAQPTFQNSLTPEHNSMRQAWLAGYNDAFKDLRAITKAPVGREPLPEEWSHYN